MTDETTRNAAAFYGNAAKARASASCCAVAAPALAPDYARDDLAAAPAEAVAASFGCGDPLAFADVKRGQTVLDLGCGAGLDLIIAAGRVGPEGRVIGVDASADMLRLAAKNIGKAGIAERVTLREGAIEALPVENASVDWIISNCVVNLSPDKAKVFREIRRALKPGGKALISDLVADDLPGWTFAHRDLYSACIAGALSEHEYVALAADAGLANAKIIDRITYDAGMVRAMLADALPVAVDVIAERLNLSREAFIDMAGNELSGRIASIKLSAERCA